MRGNLKFRELQIRGFVGNKVNDFGGRENSVMAQDGKTLHHAEEDWRNVNHDEVNSDPDF